jgi:succinate dehydrogenase/fumarate reductase flavoprotein subunit
MMTRRFRLVAVSLGAFSLGAAIAAAQTPTRASRATTVAVLTAATNAPAPATSAARSRIDAPVPLSARQMRETVGAGWWQTLVTIVGGVVESVVEVYVLDIAEAACMLTSCG